MNDRRWSRLLALFLVSAIALTAIAWPVATLQAQNEPMLDIQDEVAANSGESVAVPIVFTSNENAIGSVAFSIDFDETNLTFDPTDGDADGIPDSMVFSLTPAAFGSTVFVDLGDTDGEIDVAVFDPFPPIAALNDGTILQITFTAIGVPEPGVPIIAPVAFSADPAPTFGDTSAQDVPGIGEDGSVLINAPPPEEQADLSVTKADSPDPVIAGNQLTYTVTVNNGGPDEATNVEVIDTLSAGVSFDAGASSAGCAEAGGVVTCPLGNIANGGSANATIVVDVDPTVLGSIDNTVTNVTADQTDPDTTNNSVTETTSVNQEVDLEVAKSDEPDPVIAGDNLTYTVVVTNNGPSSAFNGRLTDTLPAGVVFVSASAGCTELGGVVNCSTGPLDPGQSASFEIVVSTDSETEDGTVITNTAAVSPDDQLDPDASNNTATEDTTIIQAPEGVGLFIDPDETTVPVGQTFELDILARAGDQLVSGIQAFVNFDPDKLAVLDVTPGEDGIQIHPGSALTDFIQTNLADNVLGQINFVAGNFPAGQGGSGFPSGDFVLATIRFHALEPTDGSPSLVEFSVSPPSRRTSVSLSGQDVTGPLHDGMVNIVEAADVRVIFQFQGGARPKPAGWEQPVTITLDPTVGGIAQVVNATSHFDAVNLLAFVDIPAVAVGTYDISLIGPSTLTNITRDIVVAVNDSVEVDMGVLLSGNAINLGTEPSEIINIHDFTLLSDTFLLSQGNPDFDSRADFDANGTVNILDVGLLSINFLREGPVEVP